MLAGGKGRPTCRGRCGRASAAPSSASASPARPDQVVRIPSGGAVAAPVLVLTGLGPAPSGRAGYDAETLRRAAGAATRTLNGHRLGRRRPAHGRRGSRRRDRRGCAHRRLRLHPAPQPHGQGRQGPGQLGHRPRRQPAREGRPRGRRAGRGDRRRRAPHPRPGQHRARRPAPGRVRRRGRRQPQGHAGQGHRPGREGAGQGRLRRHHRRRQGFDPTAATGPAGLPAGQGDRAPRARRQGHHLRLRRPLAQAAGRHGGDEVRHGRAPPPSPPPSARSPSSACRSGSPAGCAWPRTCPPARPSAPPTS